MKKISLKSQRKMQQNAARGRWYNLVELRRVPEFAAWLANEDHGWLGQSPDVSEILRMHRDGTTIIVWYDGYRTICGRHVMALMKLKKDTLYTIIDTDFEKLHIYPDSGYTVWEKYDPQRNCNWWAAFRTGQVQDLIESCIVESDDDDDDDIEFYADDITAALEAGLEDGRYTAIIYDGSDPDSPEAFYVSEDEVDEGNGLPEPGDYRNAP